MSLKTVKKKGGGFLKKLGSLLKPIGGGGSEIIDFIQSNIFYPENDSAIENERLAKITPLHFSTALGFNKDIIEHVDENNNFIDRSSWDDDANPNRLKIADRTVVQFILEI